jgi:2-dehydro-3-deoxy-D-arabinonate dehydratase
LDGAWLPAGFSLGLLLQIPFRKVREFLEALPRDGEADGDLLPPIEEYHEVWAAGVTYTRSREARTTESHVPDIYGDVYEAERPELFFKAIGRRVVGHGMHIRVRRDSQWTVPEPELTLVLNRYLETIGYCVGNDVSSRDIEGANPLYLPQAKIYDGGCALGPGIALIQEQAELADLPICMSIRRDGQQVYAGETRTSLMKRSLNELVGYLGRELAFPEGVFLMTGTGIVPPDDFSLLPGDEVRASVGDLELVNLVL